MTAERDTSRHEDALTELAEQNRLIAEMFDIWEEKTARLEHGDSVEVRWERGSAAKLLLQYLAVREGAKAAIVPRVAEAGDTELAQRLEADGRTRREAIDRLEEAGRGYQAINMNNAEIDEAVGHLEAIFREEIRNEEAEILPAVGRLLGPPPRSGMPSARAVRLRSGTHPSPTPRWFDKVVPLQMVRALYDHLRSSPSGLTDPDVDRGREHIPGPHK
jgi:hypothetical protein